MKQTAKHASKTLNEALDIARELASRIGVPRHATEILHEAVGITAQFAGDAGVPGLSSGLEALLTILEKIQVGFSPDVLEVRAEDIIRL